MGLGTPEFQRQVVTPNVPKFTTAIMGLVEKHHDEELQVTMTFTCHVPLIFLNPLLGRRINGTHTTCPLISQSAQAFARSVVFARSAVLEWQCAYTNK
jgi:hypothetical protein